MAASVPSAATVVLLRDGMDGLETYLMRRVASMAFAPRMHVFPGGRLDALDFATAITLTGAPVEDLARRASCTLEELRALYACAVRETREETGIDIAEVGCDESVIIDASVLPIIDHWVTPEGESRRYDVRFFAAMITGDDARLTTTEADAVLWARPEDALAEFAAGRMPMLPPTESVLRWLAGFETAAQVIVAGAERPVVPLLPRRREHTDEWVLVNERTGEVVSTPIPAPHTREDDGLPRALISERRP